MRESALSRARMVVAGLLAGPLALLAIVLALGGDSRSSQLEMPAMLAGLIALPVAWRLHATLLDRARLRRDEAARIEGFVRAIVVALAITELTAMFGLVAYVLSRQASPLVGVAMHVILGGLLWPSRERLDAFLDEPGPGQP